MQPFVFFVWKKQAAPDEFRVVHREVKQRTRKGYPIRYALKAFPGSYETLEKAQRIADQLNRGELFVDLKACSEEVELE